MRRTHLLALATILLIANPAAALTIHDESVDGDLSTNGAAPTAIVFGAGANEISGSIQSSGDTRDFITFTLAPGQSLVSLILLEWSTNTGYHAINIGATSQDPGGGNIAFYLGGNHVAVEGQDLLPGLASGGIIGGPGFASPLGAGTYSYVIQQTGPELIDYTLQFNVVPEPSLAALSGLGLLTGLAFLRRRA